MFIALVLSLVHNVQFYFVHIMLQFIFTLLTFIFTSYSSEVRIVSPSLSNTRIVLVGDHCSCGKIC